MDKERETVQRLQQYRGEGSRQDDLCRCGHLPNLRRRFQPFCFRAPAPDRLEHRLEVGVTVKNQAVNKRRKALVRYVAEASDALFLRNQIIIHVFHVGDVLNKSPGVLAGHRNAGASQLRDLIGTGQHRLADDDLSPDGALPECQLKLFFTRVNIHQPFHRHDRMRTGNLIVIAVLLKNAAVICLPVAGIELQRLVREVGNVIDINGAALGLQTFHVFLVHGLEAFKSLGNGICRQFLHLGRMSERLLVIRIQRLIRRCG